MTDCKQSYFDSILELNIIPEFIIKSKTQKDQNINILKYIEMIRKNNHYIKERVKLKNLFN